MATIGEPTNVIMIGGVKVKFPCKPYPSQLSMMSKIVKGLQNQKHCLLESPTGSGKSLALLCSALAWQESMKGRLSEESVCCNAEPSTNDNAVNVSTCSLNDFASDSMCDAKHEPETKPFQTAKVPTIWFGTRTHKQISQITRELGRTEYKNVNMTILSSREHSCIHPVNERSSNKNDGCRDLLKGRHVDLPGSRCSFYQNVHRMRTHRNLYSCGLTSAWDLEDLVKLGRQIRACPYYSTRELMSTASIVFCPYNYLIDPGIRSQLNINVAGQVLIFDEAHNIEDSAREAASSTVNEMELVNTIADLDHLIADHVRVEQHQPLHLLCAKVGQWMQKCSENLDETGYETWSKVWSGKEFIQCLTEWGITADTLPILQKSYKDALDIDNETEEEEDPRVLHSASQKLLGGMFHVLSYLLYAEEKFAGDYRVTIIRQAEYGIPPPKRTREGWIAMNKRVSKYFSVNLHFWCLNPSVAFSDLTSTHCVILTSGTLSPMSSFSSELGMSFPIQLEASHVIANSQVWVGAVGSGPSGHCLQATYQNTNALTFQDELGSVVLSVCNVVPFGVLCFFSSYKMLEKLSERWKNTNLWNEISQKKAILCEPHGKNKANFQDVLQAFYEHVSTASDGSTTTGALLLAVCRGKISEGLDFSDNNARAVITVGIPFPNFKDRQVELKRKYNDAHFKSRGLLSGSDWYETQAFRALNQALGRCIRHKNDWGALIIIDDRFCKNTKRYSKGLSKWVRQKLKTFSNFQSVSESLASFCEFQRSEQRSSSFAPLCGESFTCLSEACNTSQYQNTSDSGFNSKNLSLQSDLKIESSSFSNFDVAISDIPSKTESKCVSKENNGCLPKVQVKLDSFDSFKRKIPSPDYRFTDNIGKKSTTNQPKIAQKSSNFSKIANARVDDNTTADDQVCENTVTKSEYVIEDSIDMLAQPTAADDVILIPSTPEKLDQVVVIPESPGLDFDDDFQPIASAKRKVYSNSKSNTTIAQQLAKKCKKSITFNTTDNDTKECKTKVFSRDNTLIEKGSQELFKPSSRRRRSLKASRSEKNVTPNGETSVTEIASSEQVFNCCSCHKRLFSCREKLVPVTHNFTYIQDAFSDAQTVFALSELPEGSKLEKTVRSGLGIDFDTVWSESDKLALQFFQCSNCSSLIAFHPVNSKRHLKFYMLSSKLVSDQCKMNSN